MNIRLRFVAEAQAQREIGAHAPVVGPRQSDVSAIDVQVRKPAGNGELRWTAAERRDFRGRVTTLLKSQRAPVLLDRRNLHHGSRKWIVIRIEGRGKAACERERAVEAGG